MKLEIYKSLIDKAYNKSALRGDSPKPSQKDRNSEDGSSGVTMRRSDLFFRKLPKMQITNRHIKFAKLTLEGKLKAPEIAAQCGISDRQGRNWKKHPETKRLIDAFTEAATRDAKRLLARHGKRAAQALVFLLETRAVQEGEKTRYEFVHPPEVVRKAACDILQWAGIGVQSKKQSPVTVKVVRDTISNPSVEKRALKIGERTRSIQNRSSARHK